MVLAVFCISRGMDRRSSFSKLSLSGFRLFNQLLLLLQLARPQSKLSLFFFLQQHHLFPTIHPSFFHSYQLKLIIIVTVLVTSGFHFNCSLPLYGEEIILVVVRMVRIKRLVIISSTGSLLKPIGFFNSCYPNTFPTQHFREASITNRI